MVLVGNREIMALMALVEGDPDHFSFMGPRISTIMMMTGTGIVIRKANIVALIALVLVREAIISIEEKGQGLLKGGGRGAGPDLDQSKSVIFPLLCLDY